MSKTSDDQFIGGFAYRSDTVTMFIRNRQHWLAALLLWASACISTHIPQPKSPPDNRPVEPTPLPSAPPRKGQWSIRYGEQSVTYRITRTATVQRSDSTADRENSTNLTREKVTLTVPPGDTTGFRVSAIADSFVTTAQGRLGGAAPTQLPIEVSAILSDSGLTVPAVGGDTICSPTASVISADLHNLLLPLPSRLSSGLRWQDSTQLRGCQGGILTTSRTTRTFTAIGEVVFENEPAVEIEENDSTTADGQGLQQQHQISLIANGTGRSTYLVHAITGHVLQLRRTQTLNISIKAEGKETRFVQTVEQEFDAVP